MRFAFFKKADDIGIAVQYAEQWHDCAALSLPFELNGVSIAQLSADQRETVNQALLAKQSTPIDLEALTLLPPISPTARIFCIGLNYDDHASESNMQKPEHPVVFLRTYDSFVGHAEPLIKPKVSDAFDFEGEMVAVLAKGGRYLSEEQAAECVGAYSVSNEGSIRDFQLKRGPQWTMGKNFHASGAIGPHLVTADELPPLGKGLSIHTKLNGEIVQQSDTAYMIFDLAQIIHYLSQAFVLQPGDVIVSGTPAGVGAVRTPPLFMKAGDHVEVFVEGIGTVANTIVAE